MGWVTLTLRKTELKRTHADYQKQLLDISREKRKMARQYHFQQSLINSEKSRTRNDLTTAYNAKRKEINDSLASGTLSDAERADLQNQLTYERDMYQEQLNMRLTDFEEEYAMIEDEANDVETSLDQEQVQIEAQLEAISAEIEAVGEAISSQIQASTIKLS